MPRGKKKRVTHPTTRAQKAKMHKNYLLILSELTKKLNDKNLTLNDLKQHTALKHYSSKILSSMGKDAVMEDIAKYATAKLMQKVYREELKSKGANVEPYDPRESIQESIDRNTSAHVDLAGGIEEYKELAPDFDADTLQPKFAEALKSRNLNARPDLFVSKSSRLIHPDMLEEKSADEYLEINHDLVKLAEEVGILKLY